MGPKYIGWDRVLALPVALWFMEEKRRLVQQQGNMGAVGRDSFTNGRWVGQGDGSGKRVAGKEEPRMWQAFGFRDEIEYRQIDRNLRSTLKGENRSLPLEVVDRMVTARGRADLLAVWTFEQQDYARANKRRMLLVS